MKPNTPAEHAAHARRIADRFANQSRIPERLTNLRCCGARIDITDGVPSTIVCPDCGTGWVDQEHRKGAVIGRRA